MRIVTRDFTDIYEAYLEPLRIWYALRKNNPLPSMEDFKDISVELQDYRMLSNIGHDPLRVYYFEAGRKLETLYGAPLEDRDLEELYNDYFRKQAYEGYKKLTEDKMPTYEQHGFSTIIGKIGYYKLHLPFGEGDQVTHAATYIVPTTSKIKRAFDWIRIIDRTPWFQG